jgi:hypothetical protein
MKRITLIFTVLIPLITFSQQLHYGSGGTVYNLENKKITSEEVRELLSKNTQALELYNQGRNKKTWGNVLFYGGLGLIATNAIVAMNTDNTTVSSYNSSNPYSSPSVQSERSNMTPAIIGGVLLVASIPIKIGYPKKIKNAIDIYNHGITDNYRASQKLSFICSNNQLGFRFEF